MPLNESTRRLTWLLYGLGLWAAILCGRLVWLQAVRHSELLAEAEDQQQKVEEVPALRGSILDRSGQPLAMTLEADSVAVDPTKLKDMPAAARALAASLHLDAAKLLEQMQQYKERRRHFMWVARKLAPEESARVHALELEGIEYRKEMRRFYPGGTLAAHVIGATGILKPKDVIERGNVGVELAFERDLAGTPGQARLFVDSHQDAFDSIVLKQPIPGADVTLTIDPVLQYRAERELESAIATSGAKSGSVVALDPYTGEVLAMASYPTFDPNLRPERGEAAMAVRQNLAVTKTFEPGSVFKVITLAAALESTKLTPQSMIDCGNGQINLYGRVIHDHDRYSSLSMANVLAKSSNIGAIRIAMATGERPFYEYQKRFGFGSKTGIPLPGEAAGILWPVEKWTKSSIGSLAMGHELGVTAIQLALAGAVIANGGSKVEPRLVISRQRPGQTAELAPVSKPVRIIEPETAVQMRQMMEGVVLEGTGRKAVMRGYTSGGKTGSAQVYDRETNLYTHTYNSSFLGFAPVGNPRVVIAVTLHGTTGGSTGFGGVRAAPVFREVAMTAMRMLDVPRDLPDRNPRALLSSVDENDLPDVSANDAPLVMAASAPANVNAEDGALDVAHLSFIAQMAGERPVRNGVVPSVRPLTRGETSVSTGDSSAGQRPIFSADHHTDAQGGSAVSGKPADSIRQSARNGSVPDFRGMTLRTVVQESAALGLEVHTLGSGLARSQDPPPGSALQPHAAVKVQFGR